jgi:hypothetical protein
VTKRCRSGAHSLDALDSQTLILAQKDPRLLAQKDPRREHRLTAYQPA